MTSSATIAWLVSLMVSASPPGRSGRESQHEALTRYESIAGDVMHVVEREPPLFGGAKGRERTAVLMIAVALHESAYRLDVDRGETRGRIGECSIWQIVPAERGSCDAWKDRRLAAGIALERMRRSQRACMKPGVPVEHLLAAYASGSCTRGHKESRIRVETAMRWFARKPPP